MVIFIFSTFIIFNIIGKHAFMRATEYLTVFLLKVDFEKNQKTTKRGKNFPGGKELMGCSHNITVKVWFLFGLILYVAVNSFQSCWDGSACVPPVVSSG